MDGSRLLVRLPRRHCAWLMATPLVGVFWIFSRARYWSSPGLDVLRNIFCSLSVCLAVVR